MERKLWRDLIILKDHLPEFNSFIDNMELIDVPYIGKKFTWYNTDGMRRSRLDRILLSEGLISDWGVIAQRVWDRDISDHCPVWLECGEVNWGPKN
ncbi:hypothetical protein TSUD_326110 [Trifolium subterraneum]|uniref:Endonuclease/exonuclease/phosphatase domain-containing protein n=1 Tax=Trifolium subterraneum TaxID=3900 RepID=A0A2Z6MFJ9_TRISU|nr:hypothetical protein TSUD_326110 [Trifolium subterraneum]